MKTERAGKGGGAHHDGDHPLSPDLTTNRLTP